MAWLTVLVITILGVSGNPIIDNLTNETTTVDPATECGGIVGFFHICPQNASTADSSAEVRQYSDEDSEENTVLGDTDTDDKLVLKREVDNLSPEQETGVADESHDNEDKMMIRDIASDEDRRQERQVAYDDDDDDDILELRKRGINKDNKNTEEASRRRRDDDDDYTGGVENSDNDDDSDIDTGSNNVEDCEDSEARKKRESEIIENKELVKREDIKSQELPATLEKGGGKDVRKGDIPTRTAPAANVEENNEIHRERREETKSRATITVPKKESIDKKIRREISEYEKTKRSIHPMGAETLPSKAVMDEEDSGEDDTKVNDRLKRAGTKDTATIKVPEKESIDNKIRREVAGNEKTKRDIHPMGSEILPSKAVMVEDETKVNDRKKRQESRTEDSEGSQENSNENDSGKRDETKGPEV